MRLRVESGWCVRECAVIWEIILRDFWGDILRGPQLESRIILLGRLRFGHEQPARRVGHF